MNLAECSVGAGHADLGGARLPLPAALAAPRVACKIGIRPEAIALAPRAGDDIRLPAEVLLLEPLGSETLVTLKIGKAEWIARFGADFREAPGHRLDVFVPPAALRLFDTTTGNAIVH